MNVIEKVQSIIEPSLGGIGYSLVQVRMMDSDGKRTLQVMAERNDGVDMTVDDCATISHTISALLDVEDPITEAYQLEVSSPGIDRPLVKPEDYARFKGYEAKLETVLPIDGRKRFKGKVGDTDDKNVTIECSDGPATIAWKNIQTAKLVLTDELVREELRKHKQKTKTN